MALERRAHTRPSPASEGPLSGGLGTYAATSRRAAAVARKPRPRGRVEPPRVQILVVVANIQTRTLKAEVEKGSM